MGLPLVSSYGPQNIWDLTKDTFIFLKTVCDVAKKDETPHYEFNNNGDVTLRIGDEHHHYNGPVFQIGKLALPNYQDLAHLIGSKKLTEISAGARNTEARDIYLGKNDKETFDIPTKIKKETTELKCEVFDFNKYKNIGKLSVSTADQEIPQGEYNFTIFGDQDNVDYIYSMLKPEVVLHCLVEELRSPFGGIDVVKLHVTGVGS